MKQTTFLMFKPDAYREGLVDTLKKELINHGLVIEKYVDVPVDNEVMQTLIAHYKEVIDEMEPDFNFVGKLFNSFYYKGPHTVGPMLVSYEGDEDIITFSRELIGKTSPELADKDSLRGKYASDGYTKAGQENRLVNNLIHASDSKKSAKREIEVWQKYFK